MNLVDANYSGKEPYSNEKGQIVLEQGMIFPNVDGFRAALRDYTVETGFKIVRLKNEKARVTAKCGAEGCPWRIHASPLPDGITYKIKTMQAEHTCSRQNHNTEATSSWIAKKMIDEFKENPSMGLDTMQEKLNKKYGIEASTMQLFRARRKCLDELEGNHGSQYTLLPTYVTEVRKSNPGSVVKIKYQLPPPNANPDIFNSIPQYPVFQRFYFCFDALKKGFVEGCRPFIGMDGCHLKGPYGGVVISAVGLDGNNGLFPLAFAVVESENKESWSFFLENLRDTLNDSLPTRPWVIMSDQQKVTYFN